MRSASIGYQCPNCASDSTPIIKGINRNRFIPNQKNTPVTKFLSISLHWLIRLVLFLGILTLVFAKAGQIMGGFVSRGLKDLSSFSIGLADSTKDMKKFEA